MKRWRGLRASSETVAGKGAVRNLDSASLESIFGASNRTTSWNAIILRGKGGGKKKGISHLDESRRGKKALPAKRTENLGTRGKRKMKKVFISAGQQKEGSSLPLNKKAAKRTGLKN